jgi:hypothetical protein
MEELRYAFERCASTITHISPDTQIQFKEFNVIDQDAWENIRSGISVGKTWFFQLIFRRDGHSWSYLFSFGKHYWTDMDTDRDKSEPRVCLLIAEQIGSQTSVRLDQTSVNTVTIKELFVAGKTFVRRRYAPETSTPELYTELLDHDLEADIIAQDFIREVMLHRIA